MDIARPELMIARRRRNRIYAVLGGLGLAATVFFVMRLQPSAPILEKSAVWTDVVKRGELMIEVRGPGTLLPKTTRWISAETAARVERLIVKPGAQVQADTVIMELSNPEVLDAMLAAQAALTAARADLAATEMQLKSQLLDQRANLSQVQADLRSANLQTQAESDLAKKGVIPAITFQRTELARDQLTLKVGIERERVAAFEGNVSAQIAAARARLAQLENTAKLRGKQAAALNVVSGITGVLQQVPVEEGQQIAAGVNLARVARPDVLMAALKVPETQAKDVTVGQIVRVDTRNGVIAGTVSRLDPAVQNGTVQVDVELTGAMPEGARPDLSVDGVIEIARLQNVLFVGRPNVGQPMSNTTLFKMQNDDSKIYQRVPVQLGKASVSMIEVTNGLKEGDRVILSDTNSVERFDRVRVQ
jgi:HlyD family secretion protein